MIKRQAQQSTWILVILVGLLLLGLGLRLFDLSDQPIDFHPTRQLRGMIIARGMYYEMLPNADENTRQQALAFWASTGQYEPSILERIVAISYLIAGKELPWLARVYNSLFWLIGGLAVFDLTRRIARSSLNGDDKSTEQGAASIAALAALAYYLALPFGVQASRSFQPDPSMVVWITLAAWAVYRWSEQTDWKWAVLSGVFSGMAVFTKAIAFYTIAGILLSVGIYTYSKITSGKFVSAIKALITSPQFWLMGLLTVLPTGIYYLQRGGRASEYFSSWTLALLHLLLEPATYLRWLKLIAELLTPVALVLALVGIVLARGRGRALLAGLWVGYIAYGLFLPYQMTSHSYYHLQLMPIMAISLAPLFAGVVRWLEDRSYGMQMLSAAAVLALLIIGSWQALVPLYSKDYRNEPAYWQEIASKLPEKGKIIALTQDYGYRLMYYGWRKVVLWPNRGEIKLSVLRGSEKEFRDYFSKRVEGKDYFLITAFNQYQDQPALKKILQENFPILAQTNGYIIFDLTQPLRSG